jgi:hypothetical protein
MHSHLGTMISYTPPPPSHPAFSNPNEFSVHLKMFALNYFMKYFCIFIIDLHISNSGNLFSIQTNVLFYTFVFSENILNNGRTSRTLYLHTYPHYIMFWGCPRYWNFTDVNTFFNLLNLFYFLENLNKHKSHVPGIHTVHLRSGMIRRLPCCTRIIRHSPSIHWRTLNFTKKKGKQQNQGKQKIKFNKIISLYHKSMN